MAYDINLFLEAVRCIPVLFVTMAVGYVVQLIMPLCVICGTKLLRIKCVSQAEKLAKSKLIFSPGPAPDSDSPLGSL